MQSVTVSQSQRCFVRRQPSINERVDEHGECFNNRIRPMSTGDCICSIITARMILFRVLVVTNRQNTTYVVGHRPCNLWHMRVIGSGKHNLTNLFGSET